MAIPAGYSAVAKNVYISGSTLTIAATGNLALNGAGGVPSIQIEGAALNNSGTIQIGNVSSAGSYGMFLTSGGTVTNNAGASIEINRINGNPIALNSNFTANSFTNHGTIKIGGIASSNGTGISLGATTVAARNTLSNSGLIEINNLTAGDAISNNGSDLTNTGTITIGNLSAIPGHGLRLFAGNSPTISNNAGGILNIGNVNASGTQGLFIQVGSNAGTFNNAGTLNFGNTASVRNAVRGSFTNYGTVSFGNVTDYALVPQTGGQFTVLTNAIGATVQTIANGKLRIGNGSELINQSGGTVTNNASGTITLEGGTSITNNSGGTVTNNGLLEGTGVIVNSGSFTNTAGSHISPGGTAAIGTINVTGAFPIGSAVLDIQLNSASSFDELTASGSIGSLSSATLNATLSFTPTAVFTALIINGPNNGISPALQGTPPGNLAVEYDVPNGSVWLAYNLDVNAISGSPFCAGAAVSVGYTRLSGVFNSGNVFTAQLSDASGSFTSPVSIGTLTSTTSGTISATIPSSTPAGTGYRIRVVASNPVAVSYDNGVNLNVNALPTATISGNGGSICAGNTASFTLSGTSGATVSYTLNGGTPATTTLTGGTATVTVNNATANQTLSLVSVTDGTCSQNLSGTSIVTVNALPTATISANSGSFCSGSTASFTLTGTSGAIVNYTLNGTPATATLTGGTATVAVNNATADQTLNLVSITDGTCSQNLSGSSTLLVSPPPSATISANNGPICSGTTASFTLTGTAGSTVTYDINGGTQATATLTGGTATVTVSNATGNQTLNLVSVTGSTCTQNLSGSSTVVVNALPSATISTNNGPVCSGNTASFTLTGTAGSTVTYDINGGTQATTTLTGGTATVTISNSSANQTLNLVSVTDGTCSQNLSGSSTVVVNPLPSATISANNGPICSGTTASFTLTGTAGATVTYTINNGANATVILNGSGAGTVSVSNATADQTLSLVSVSGTGNCSQTLSGSSTVVINPLPQGSLTANGPFCGSGTGQLTFTATSGTGPYTVVYSDGTNRTVNNVVSATGFNVFTNPVTATKTYTLVSVTDANTCARSTAFTGNAATITVNAIPAATATPAAQTICNGTAITTIALTSTVTGTTYAWTRDNTTNVTGIATPGTGSISGSLTNTVTGANIPAETTTFSITPTANGCAGSPITATVTVNPTPDVAQPANQIVCNNGTVTGVTFTVTTANTTYNWTNSATSIGLAASGAGNVGSFTATNNTSSPVTATVTVTPSIAAASAYNSITSAYYITYSGGNP